MLEKLKPHTGLFPGDLLIKELYDSDTRYSVYCLIVSKMKTDGFGHITYRAYRGSNKGSPWQKKYSPRNGPLILCASRIGVNNPWYLISAKYDDTNRI